MIKSSRWFPFLRTGLVLVISLLTALVIIILVSDVPGKALTLFLFGPLDSLRHFGNVLELMVPLIFTGLAVTLMFSASQFNLGAEGAFFVGAVGASFVAVNWQLPPLIHSMAGVLAGGILGSVFCGIPGVLKAKWGASELVSSLMFNYIALFLGLFFINYYLRDTNAGAMVSPLFKKSARLLRIIPKTRVSLGLVISLMFTFQASRFLFQTRWGYEIRVMGKNLSFARYAGINTNQVLVLSQILGGALAGMGGAVEVLGMYRRFSWQQLPGYGWGGVIVAILARGNPVFIPLGAFLLAYMRIGADIMSRSTDVSNEFVAIIQGVMILLVAAESFMAKYKHKLVFQETARTLSPEGGL